MQTMRQKGIRTLMALGFVAATALTAGAAQAASGNGPYYAEPSWSQKLPAATRFVVLLDWNSEAVLDRETGLVWEKSPQTSGLDTWEQARSRCLNKIAGGRKGWRLPSILELTSLVEPGQTNPALLPGHPFISIQTAFYRSATTDAAIPSKAWVVDFLNGDVFGLDKTSLGSPAWCVRGGMNAEAY